MTTLDVDVTAEHIAAGVRSDPWLCPLARALRDALPPETEVMAGQARIVITLPGSRKMWLDTPRLVGARIRRYDRGANIRPFTFTLELSAVRAS